MELTVSQAIAQGYTLYGYADRDYQSLYNLADIQPQDFEYAPQSLVLAGSEPQYMSIDGESIWDFVQDSVLANSEICDDTDDIAALLKSEIDWEEIAQKINTALQKKPYYFLTQIKLVPDPDRESDRSGNPAQPIGTNSAGLSEG